MSDPGTSKDAGASQPLVQDVTTGLIWAGVAHVCRNSYNQFLALNGKAETLSGRLQAIRLTSHYAPGTVGSSFNFVSQIIHLGVGNGGSGYLAKLYTNPAIAAAFSQPATNRPALRLAGRAELVMWRMTFANAYADLSMLEFGNLCGGFVGSAFGTESRVSFMSAFATFKNYAPRVMAPKSIAMAAPPGAIILAAYVTAPTIYEKYKDAFLLPAKKSDDEA